MIFLLTVSCSTIVKAEYLSAEKAVDYIKNGYSLICKKGDRDIIINRNVVFAARIGGVYMFTSNYNPKYAGISPEKCKLYR